MLVLYETPGGYALFKVQDKSKLTEAEDLSQFFQTADDAKAIVKLKDFKKFEDTNQALAAAAAICDGTLDETLKTFLQESIVAKEVKGKLAVVDSKLGGLIKDQLGIKCVYDNTVLELIRGIRSQIDNLLLSHLSDADKKAMKLGLSHSLGRHKIKFSPEKVDTMIIHGIALLDELDKELNTYAMRVREWYGWHFPEMGKIVTDNIHYAKVVMKMGVRTAAHETDFSDILPEDTEKAMKEAAQVSMGTEISDDDVENIKHLCDQVINIAAYRAQLYDYISNRMNAIAPNLTVMVGELVGARLIAHAGSLISLAKHPASTVQILGAEKALFRALKTKHDTPKYGLIYHASLVGQAAPKFKGKISRVLAAKTSLAVRMDALGDSDEASIGVEGRQKVENRLRQLEGGKVQALSGTGKAKAAQQKFEKKPVKEYNPAADSTMDVVTEERKQAKSKQAAAAATEPVAEKKKKRKADDDDDDEEKPAAKAEAKKSSEKPEKKKKKKDDSDSDDE